MTREEEYYRYCTQVQYDTYQHEGQPCIEDAIKWADTHPANPWHKASEELPPHFGDYLVIIDSKQFGRRYDIKCWYGNPDDPFNDKLSKEWILEDDEIVSYWMEIPEIKED